MALHILPGQPGIGYQLGRGLGAGLQTLAQQKLNQYDQTKSTNVLRSLGLNPEEAQLLSQNPQLLQPFLEKGGLAALRQEQEQPSVEQIQSAQQAFESDPEFRAFAEKQPEFQSIMQALQEGGPSTTGMFKSLQKAPLSKAIQQTKALPETRAEKLTQIPEQQAITQPGRRPKSALDVLAQPSAREQREEAYRAKKLALEEEKLARTERRAAFKETKEERKKITEGARVAKQNIRDLDRLEELNRENNLDSAGYVEFLKRSGLDFPALLSPESEEFQKIAANFMRDAKTYFGGRVSNFEIENFLKTIPSLSQSPEGRKRVMANLKYINNAALAYNDAYKEVLQKNKDIPPLDLAEQIDDKIDTKLGRLSEKFREDLRKSVPAPKYGQFLTALQALAGSLIGAPGKLIGSAAGKAIGSLL